MKYIPDYRKFVNERINLKAYWTWNPKSQLYDKVNESAMSELDLLAKEAKDFKSFVKEFKKEFKNMDAGSPKELEAWLQTIYDSVKETMDESAVTEGKTSAAYIDPKTGKGYDLQYVSSKKRWELDIMKKGASIYSSAITTIKRDTLKEIQDWLDGYKIDSKWTQGLSESLVTEAKMPNKYIGNDEIVYLKTKEDSKGAHYNLYYKGHDIDAGGRRFGSSLELTNFADDYILSNQLYNKLKHVKSKPLPESVNEGKEKKLNTDLGNIPGTFAEEDINQDDAEFYDIKPGKYIKFYIEDVSNSTILKVKRIAKANGLKFAKDLDDMLLFKESVNEAEKAEGDRSKLSADIEKALKDKATESGVPIGLLRLVMRRGLDAWNSSHREGVPQVAWGYARVNAFLEKGKGTWGKADADVAQEVIKGGHDKNLKKA